MPVYIFFILILVSLSQESITSSIHDFHLSKCDVDFSKEEKSLQISISLFIDDLELALAQQGFDSLRICTPRESEHAESLILSYLSKHLAIKVDENPVQLEWVGKETSEDLSAVWCYLQVSSVDPREEIFIRNEVLMHLFEDQQNLVKIKFSKSKKSFFLFDRSEYSGSLIISS